MGPRSDGGGGVPTRACPAEPSPAVERAIRARRAARAAERKGQAEARAEARDRAEDALDGAVAAELDRLARAPRLVERVRDPHALHVGARVQGCDGTRFLVLKVSKVQPSRDQVAVELFKRIGD